MYIHGYQIHNVLNVYRKQLSQPASAGNSRDPSPAASSDRINLSRDGQRQSIFDKISTDIVDRITRLDASPRFESVINEKLTSSKAPHQSEDRHIETEFSYNVIDEHNQKITNKLPLQRLNPLAQRPGDDTETGVAGDHQNEKE